MAFIQRIETNGNYANAGYNWYAIVEDITKKGPKGTGRVFFWLLCDMQYKNKNNEDGECLPAIGSQRKLAEELKKHPTQIQRCLKWLQSNGWVKISTDGPTPYHVNCERFNEMANDFGTMPKLNQNKAYEDEANEAIRMINNLRNKTE